MATEYQVSNSKGEVITLNQFDKELCEITGETEKKDEYSKMFEKYTGLALNLFDIDSENPLQSFTGEEILHAIKPLVKNHAEPVIMEMLKRISNEYELTVWKSF